MREQVVLAGDAIADEPVTWPVLGHACLGEGRVADFVRDRVETPDGTVMERDYVLHPGAVGVIAVDEQGRVVVVRQVRHPVGFRLIEPPAGLLERDDASWLAAAQRELAEEVGLAAADWRVLVDVMTSPGCLQETLRVFLARDLSEVAAPEGFVAEDEEADMDVRRVPLADLVAAIFAGRVQNPTLVVGVLAAHAALGADGGAGLRPADAPWPARQVKAERDRVITALGGQVRPR